MTNMDFTIDAYKQYLEQKATEDQKEYLELKIAALEAVNKKSEEYINELFNTAVFNPILKGYMRMALKCCDIDERKIEEIMEELRYILDTSGAAVARTHE